VTIDERLSSLGYRGPGFDEIRLLAATIVLIHHSRIVEYSDIRLDPLFLFSKGVIHFGFLAVAIFFSISGFLVTPGLLRSQSVLDFAANRIVRIFPALIVVVFATMLLLGPLITKSSLFAYLSDPLFYRYPKNITTLLSNFLPGVTFRGGNQLAVVNTALWTLHFEVLCYISLAFASIIGILRRRQFFLVLFFASYVTNAIISLFPPTGLFLPDRLMTFIELFVYFAAGTTLFLYGNKIPFSRLFAALAFVSMLVALPFGYGVLVLPLCVPYLVIYAGLSALPGRLLLRSDLSYGVYLIHAPILVALGIFLPNVRNGLFMASLVFPVTLLLAYLSWEFIEAPSLQRKRDLSTAVRKLVGLASHLLGQGLFVASRKTSACARAVSKPNNAE